MSRYGNKRGGGYMPGGMGPNVLLTPAPPPPVITSGPPGSKPVGYLMMSCLETLRLKSPQSFRLVDLELATHEVLKDNHQLMTALQNHPKITYDVKTKTYRYCSPFLSVASKEDMLRLVDEAAELGLPITNDMTEANSNIPGYVNALLKEKQVRAVRRSNDQTKLRCKKYPPPPPSTIDTHHSPPSGAGGCSLYASRCEACKDLVGIRLFPLADCAIEQSKADDDIRTLWQQCLPKDWDEVARDMNITLGPYRPPHIATEADASTIRGKKKRRRQQGHHGGEEDNDITSIGRQKIKNVHLLDKETGLFAPSRL